MGLPTPPRTFARHRSAGSSRRATDERGLVIVWLAVTLTVLLGVSAFAIDVAYWQTTKNREQRAADAAALAGAVSFPGNGTQANASAADIAQSNGYGSGGTVTPIPAGGTCSLPASQDSIVCGGAGDQTYQYKVTVLKRVTNYFGGIFGINQTTVRATAQAEYLKPLTMGSPSNQYGNDPDSITSWPLNGTVATYPNFWANIAGGSSPKANGDAYTAGTCDGTTDGCSGSGANMNLDKKPGGYYYAVDFKNTSTVKLQAFDPAFVSVGDKCNESSLATAAALPAVPDYPQGNNPALWAKRYAPVGGGGQTDPGFQYCTGDMLFANPPPATTYTILKATVPGQPSGAEPVSGCPPITFPGFTGDISVPLKNGTTLAGAPAEFVKYFRQWYDLCSVTGQAGDEYFIEVQTDAGSSGHNRYAVRAVTTSGSAAPVAVAGNTYMGMYANVGQAQTQFYLARVPSAAAHHTLVLNFFDIGDATGEGTLTIVPPVESNVGSSFSNCKFTGTVGGGARGTSDHSTTSPWGPSTDIDGCQITGVNRSGTLWNGQWSTVTIQIPSNYTCDDNSADGCWVKINYLFPLGLADTTSWNAYLLGDPVRLTK